MGMKRENIMNMLLLVDNYYIGASGSCSGIYCFENLLDGKKYTGQGQVLKKRRQTHFGLLEHNKDSEYFQEAWNKDGKENFRLYIVEECSIELLNEKEVYWIAKLHSHVSDWGYNISWGGGAFFRGRHHSPETIQKMKDNMPDKSGENHWNYGKKLSSETIQKIKDNIPYKSGINHPRITKKEIVQDIKRMLDDEICITEIQEVLGIGKSIIRKVKNGFYENIYNIEGIINYKKEIIQQVKDMLDNGIRIPRIARELNIDVNIVYRTKNGFYKNSYGIEGSQPKKEKIQQIENMLNNNIRICKIIKILRVCRNTVYKVKNGGYKDIYGI